MDWIWAWFIALVLQVAEKQKKRNPVSDRNAMLSSSFPYPCTHITIPYNIISSLIHSSRIQPPTRRNSNSNPSTGTPNLPIPKIM